MACGPGGCGDPQWMESRLLMYLILGACSAVSLIWVEGHQVLASVLIGVPLTLAIGGSRLSPYLDRGFIRLVTAWRASSLARRPGRLYCPECACALATAPAEKSFARAECPQCLGLWCASDDFVQWLAPYETKLDEWRPHSTETDRFPPLCPHCAVELDAGHWTGLPSFARCSGCQGQWVPRLARVWFDLNPPGARCRAVS